MKTLIQQILKFGVTGVINTIIDFGIFNLLIAGTGIRSGWPLGLINVLAVALAATNSYFMNRTWTFRADSNQHTRQIFKFVTVTTVGMLINSAVLMGISSLSSIVPISLFVVLNAGKVLGAIFSATWNFIAYRQWVFIQPVPSVLAVENISEPVRDMLSIIIPAYNESSRLENRVKSLALDIKNCSYPVEVIIINDGSRDNTLELAQKLADDFSFVTSLTHQINQGKGAAVRTGVMAARGEFIVFVDADNTFSFVHISKILDSLKAGNQIAIGSREGDQQRLEGESWLRRIMGRAFNLYVQTMVLPGITDTQCGLKGFRRQAAHSIFALQRLHRFAFDVELLALARAMHYDIARVPITAVDCAGSTVNPLLAPIQMAWDIIIVKLGLIFNLYGLKDNTQFKLDTGIAVALFTAAMAFRLPWLWQVPRYIDELKEVNLAFSIYLGKVLPLHNSAQDIGAMHNYILAGLFGLFGPSIYLPRLYVAITSAITVILVYRLGHKLFNRQVGIVAACLLLTNGMHIMVTHMAWSNCTTPLFFVLALLATINARDNKSGWWLLAAALLWAATLQTHSSAIIYVIVATIYVLSPGFRRSASIKPGWYLGSLLVFIGAYGNMIYYNIISHGGSFTWVGHKTYALEAHPGLASYLHNAAQMSVELLRAVSSTYTEYHNLIYYFFHPLFILTILLLIIGICQAIKQHEYLLILVIAGGLAIIPWINARYTFYLATRYIMPQIICAILLISLAMVTIFQKYRFRLIHPRVVTSIIVTVFLVVICLQPLPYYNYCRQISETNDSNMVALKVIKIVRSAPRGKSVVLLDRDLPLVNRPLPTLLTLSQQRFNMLPLILDSRQEDTNIWTTAIGQYRNKEIIAVLSQASYERLRAQLPVQDTHSLSSRVVIPKPLIYPETIYVVKINGHDNIITNTRVSSNNSNILRGEIK